MPLLKLSPSQCELINVRHYETFTQEIREALSSGTYTGISLDGLNIDSNNAEPIMRCLRGINGLHEISFAWTGLNDESLAITLANLDGQTDLTSLDLKKCQFSSTGYNQLFDFLIQHPHITNLSLRAQELNDEKFNSFKNKIAETKLSRLDVSYNNLSDTSMYALAAIARSASLTDLTIGRNRTTTDGMKAFAKALQNTNVTHVELIHFFDYEDRDLTDPTLVEALETVCSANKSRPPILLSSALQGLSISASPQATSVGQPSSTQKLTK